jgi:mRNA interferase RelE/StbE
VYRITDDKAIEICEVWAVGARADSEVCAEATARAQTAAKTRPECIQLAQLVEQLGRLAGDVVVPLQTPREPVPDWLADRLIYTAGMTREAVASMDLQQAVDAWTAYTSQQR